MDRSETNHHTYIRRRGRITSAQQRGYDLAQDRYRFSTQVLTNAGCMTGLEIGFGMGHALVHWAISEPSRIIVGADLYQPGIGSLAHMLDEQGVGNVFIAELPAQELIASMPDATLDEVRIYFPAPWPKKRHFKRRLIQPQFLHDLRRVLRKDAIVKLATDWVPYAQWMREHFDAAEGYQLVYDRVREVDQEVADNAALPQDRPATKFERRGEQLGHEIHDLGYSVI